MVALWIAIAAGSLCALAEWLHARRVRRIAYLAFGPEGRPASWTPLAVIFRIGSFGLLTWSLVVLWQVDAAGRSSKHDVKLADDEIAHLVIALDVSPSMDLVDAGPAGTDNRATRARDVLRSMIDRIDLQRVRVSVIAFFGTARPVVVDTFDPEVVANILADLPLEQAFQTDKTNMYAAVEMAGDISKKWKPESATLVLVSDGDTLPAKKPIPVAAAFGDVLIVGVGDAHRGQFIDGHVSRQDATSLEQLALRLGGDYFDANVKQIPSSRVERLAVAAPADERQAWDRRETAVAAVLFGAGGLMLIGPLLALCGGAWNPARAKPHVGFNFRAPRAEAKGAAS